MSIRGPVELVDIATFTHELLALGPCSISIRYADKDSGSECVMHNDGSFDILIENELEPDSLIRHVAHEMVHLKQFKRDELTPNEHGAPVWKGTVYPHVDDEESDEYFLSPWEMEARGMEAWIEHRFIQYKNQEASG